MYEQISAFRGEYFFLSNFYLAPIVYNGYSFLNNEAAFQAAKCPERASEFCQLNPSAAKHLGRRVQLRSDWEYIKDNVMYEICKAKFYQNPDLATKLIETKDAELIEGNTWGDTVWGTCNGTGENRLGKILMRIRSEIQKEAMTPIVRELRDEIERLQTVCENWEKQWNGEYIMRKSLEEKLSKYETAEKEGLLVKLPCKIGTPAFYMYLDCKQPHKHEYCTDHKGGCKNCPHREPKFIPVQFDYGDIPRFGETVFLTRDIPHKSHTIE